MPVNSIDEARKLIQRAIESLIARDLSIEETDLLIQANELLAQHQKDACEISESLRSFAVPEAR
jgi:hypothetical protein